MQYKWRVKKSERGITLENYIYKQLGDWSHKQVKTAIDRKRAFVNGKNVFISKWNLKPNDCVEFMPGKNDLPQSQNLEKRYRFVDVLHEDNHIIVTNKSPFIDFESYAQTVMEYLKRKNRVKSFPYLGQMHRLDKETSGVMVFTKKKVANTLADQFRDHSIQKFYLAVVQGAVESEQGKIDAPLEKGEFEDGKKVRVNPKEGKKALTHYRVVERYEKATLVRVQIYTGRTHQIRVHMAHLGHPLIGDKLYCDAPQIDFRRQALHAERLDFVHPVSRQKMKIVAPLFEDMAGLVDGLRGG